MMKKNQIESILFQIFHTQAYIVATIPKRWAFLGFFWSRFYSIECGQLSEFWSLNTKLRLLCINPGSNTKKIRNQQRQSIKIWGFHEHISEHLSQFH